MFSRTRRIAARQLGIGLGVGRGQLVGGDADRLGRQLGLVDPRRVVEHGRQPRFAHVAADPLDDLLRRERLAENFASSAAGPPR